ncbi:LOW QUALITY PROTEIN: hypothetical protein KUTeg_009238 [Tegillarca granosa]|uniref:Integrase catalytic domain-containing protein n=1 Tax=Tegillarca granosa TaxID=220873 RepID=A0ABQ9FAA6_TEGGR|nr:LOW QUALITY PROTEIN: hypothetical protein KUTeg_009238 [Tegillarca granosa]
MVTKSKRIFTTKSVPNKLRRRREIYYPNNMFDADLLSVESIRYFLMCIDIFARKLYLKTHVNKQSKTVLEDIKKKFETTKRDKYLNSINIKHIITQNTTKANHAEIANRWFKLILYKYFTQKNTNRYLDVRFSRVVHNKPHSSSDYNTPNPITKDNWFKFWHTQDVPQLNRNYDIS